MSDCNNLFTRRLTPAHIDLRPWPPLRLESSAHWQQNQTRIMATTHAGRSVAATRKLPPGSLLLSERACLQWLYNGPQRQRRCFRCFRRVIDRVPCRGSHACRWNLVYCSKRCESQQWWQHHRWVCRFPELDKPDMVDLLLALQVLPGTLDDLETGMHDPEYDAKIERLSSLFYMPQQQITQALVTTLAQIRCNSFAVKQSHSTAEKDIGGTLGKAVYLSASMFNHACDPNALVFFDDHDGSVQIRTSKSIDKDQGIFISYGPLASREGSTSKRRQTLWERYFFECHCDACDSRPSSAPSQQCAIGDIQCQACEIGRLERNQSTCGNCHSAYDWDQLAKQEQRIDLYLAQGKLTQALEMQRRLYDKDALSIGQTLDQLAHVYAMQGSFKASAQYSRESLGIVCKTFGPTSIEAAEEMMKLSTLLFNALV